MPDEDLAGLEVQVALLRSSLFSAGEIIQGCRGVIERPAEVDEERRRAVLEVLDATLRNIQDILEKLPAGPAGGGPSPAPEESA